MQIPPIKLMRQGVMANVNQSLDNDRAVIEYTKAVQARPDDRTLRALLDQAKVRAAQDHFSRARRMASVGKLEEALVEYQLAAELNPSNETIQQEMQTARVQLRAKAHVDVRL